jgi:hypothetical protein
MLVAVATFAADAFDFKYAKMELLQLKPIQAEVKLTEAQRASMNTFADAHREKLKQMQAKIGQRAPNKAEQQQIMGYYNTLRSQVLGQLSAAQLKRLREITFQLADISPLMDSEIAKRVGMSTAQVTTMRNAFKAGATQLQKLEKDTLEPILKPYQNIKPKDRADAQRLQREVAGKVEAARKKVAPQLQRLQSSTRAKMIAVLTPAQKTAWASLQGKKFDVSKLK